MDHLTDGALIGRPPAGRSPTAGSRRRRHDDRGPAHPGPTRAYPAAQSAASGTHLITPQAAPSSSLSPRARPCRLSHHDSRARPITTRSSLRANGTCQQSRVTFLVSALVSCAVSCAGKLLLCCCASRADLGEIVGERFEDLISGLGPGEGPGVLVPGADPRLDVVLQGFD